MRGPRRSPHAPVVAPASNVAPVILALACWALLGGAGATAARWQPLASQRLRWQYQLSGTIDTTIQADVFDIDLVDVPSTVSVCGDCLMGWVEWGENERNRLTTPGQESLPHPLLSPLPQPLLPLR